ncbi:NUDIX hydrolase [Enterococcus durans]|uniref:ADP-ribose pyrophosphatase n=1 Tax=Enterococcus durans TaxID=53345 RepID=A0A377KHM5_9ENTE|nr:NUDIX hydrolase [Enterococcus durans]STP28556.1 ADP-ribose pyrophosphatase [Enterococcus durans]
MQTRFDQYRRLLTIAEAGLLYGKDVFDKERYEELRTIALELLSGIGTETSAELFRLTEQNEGYPTPKIDVRAYIKQEDKVLLIEDKRTKEWALPGGFAEVGLSPKENIEKEVEEETGLIVTADKLLALFDTNIRKDVPQLFQYYKLVFSCTILAGSFVENSETSNSAFFALDELPPLSIKRTTKEQLAILANGPLPYFD